MKEEGRRCLMGHTTNNLIVSSFLFFKVLSKLSAAWGSSVTCPSYSFTGSSPRPPFSPQSSPLLSRSLGCLQLLLLQEHHKAFLHPGQTKSFR